MTNPLNRTKVTQIVTRISKEINTIGEMKFPNTIFLEIGENMPVLQLITKNPDQKIDVNKYIDWIEQWSALGIEKELVGKMYQEQVTLLCEHLPYLERHLGLMVLANAAQLHPTIPVIKRTYWLDFCFAPVGMEHNSDIFAEIKRATRIYGECELTPGLIDAIDKGVIDPNLELPDLLAPIAKQRQMVMDILTPEQRTLAEELIKSRDASKGVDYSDCRTQEDVVAKFAGTFGLNPQQVVDGVGPVGFLKDIDPATFQYGKMGQGYWDGIRIPDTIEDPEAAEGHTFAIKTGKEFNLYPELKVKTSDTVERLRAQCGMHHRQDYGDVSIAKIGGMNSLATSSPFGRGDATMMNLILKDIKMAVVADSVEHATQLFLTMTDEDLQHYAEKTGLTMKEMQYSITLLRSRQLQVKMGYPGGNTGKPIYLIDIFDVESVSEYELRKHQLILDTKKSPEYKIEQMELNVSAHKQYMAELYRLMYYAKEMSLEKRLDQLYLLIHHANNFSNDQMVHFHIELGEGLIGEFEAPVDRGNWQTMCRLFEKARSDVIRGIEAGQDVTTLAGYSYNAQSLGEEPMDVSERVDIFLEHQHDAFFVIPLELWNGK